MSGVKVTGTVCKRFELRFKVYYGGSMTLGSEHVANTRRGLVDFILGHGQALKRLRVNRDRSPRLTEQLPMSVDGIARWAWCADLALACGDDPGEAFRDAEEAFATGGYVRCLPD